jgi:hypothetical protein
MVAYRLCYPSRYFARQNQSSFGGITVFLLIRKTVIPLTRFELLRVSS